MADLEKQGSVPPTVPYSTNEKDILDSKDTPAHVEVIDDKGVHDWDALRAEAIKAEDAERSLGLIGSLKQYPTAAFWSFAISLLIIMEGYDTAVLGNVLGLNQFRKKFGHFNKVINGVDDYQLKPEWQLLVNQAPNFGCLFGIYFAGIMQDRWGYKRTLQIGLVMLTGFIFIVFFAPRVEVLFVGEFLCGIPWGAFSSSAVSYASDVAPIGLRGYLTTYVNLCWVIGQILAAGILRGANNIKGDLAYQVAFAVQWVWPIPLFILVTLAPESPWYLVRKGRLEDAKKSVQRLSAKNGSVDPEATVAMMIRTNQIEKEHSEGVTYLDCFKGTDRRRTGIGCMAWMCQQLCGMALCGNAVYFFQQAGMDSSNSFNMNLGVTFMAFTGTILSWITLTYFGRRIPFVAGMFMMLVCLLIIGGLAFSHNANAKWGQAALVMIFVFTYDFTIGPLTYCIVGEVSSTRLRSKSVGLARNAYNVVSIVGGVLNTYFMNPTAWNLGPKSAFFWAATCLVGALWALFCLPEMRGRSMRALDVLFERKTPARKFTSTYVDDTDEGV